MNLESKKKKMKNEICGITNAFFKIEDFFLQYRKKKVKNDIVFN